MKKITVVGAGRVGESTAQFIASQEVQPPVRRWTSRKTPRCFLLIPGWQADPIRS